VFEPERSISLAAESWRPRAVPYRAAGAEASASAADDDVTYLRYELT